MLFPIPDTFDPNNADARTIRQCKQHIFVSLAGPAAEYHVTGEERWDVHHYEFAAANNLIMYLVGNAEVLNSYSQFMWVYTRTTMRIPKHWVLVQALAQALLEHQTLSSRAVRRCLREALSQQTGIPVDQLRVPRVHLL